MNMNLIHIFEQMDLFARLVALSLVAMAIASLSVFFDRVLAFYSARRTTKRFALHATQLLQSHQYAEVVAYSQQHNKSPLLWVLGEGARAFLRATKTPGQVAAHELVRRELERKSEELYASIRRGMSLLASVGSVAPFVGLLGTVVGIIASFQGIAKEGSGGLGAVSAGISEALVVTALGLLVAIPAVLGFNYLNTAADNLMRGVDQARSELVDFLEAHGKDAVAAMSLNARPEVKRVA